MKTFAVVIASLAAFAAATSPAAGQTPSAKVVLVGFAGPLTGPSARIGKDLENATHLAIDDANRSHPTIGGEAVEYRLVSADDQSDPRQAVAVAQQLVDKHVIGVIGHFNTGCSVPASRVYHDAGIPEISPVSTGRVYTMQGYDTSFRVMGHDEGIGAYTATYAVRTLKAKRIAVIDDQTAFGAGMANQFIKGIKANAADIIDHQYINDKTTDYSAVLTTLKGERPDLIFFAGLDAQAGPLVRRMRQLQMSATLLGAGGFVSQTFLKLAGPEGQGVTALEPGRPLDRMPGGTAFAAKYRAKYNAPIEAYAPFSYDATSTLIAAAQRANSTDSRNIVAQLHKIERPGITATIAFDSEGNLKDPAYTIHQVRDGKWTVVDVLGGGQSTGVTNTASK
jgi:branched-chain amino acid transport system substrate-binding protein